MTMLRLLNARFVGGLLPLALERPGHECELSSARQAASHWHVAR